MINHSLLLAITDIGDSAVLVAVTVTGSLFLLATHQKRAALALTGAFLLAAGCIAALKLFFLSCSAPVLSLALHSPSGHTALCIAVFGTSALILSHGQNGWRRIVPLLLATALVIAIATSRLLLEVHTGQEVAVGATVGLCVLYLAYRVLKSAPSSPTRILMLFCTVGFFAILLVHGLHLPAEEWLKNLAAHTTSCLK